MDVIDSIYQTRPTEDICNSREWDLSVDIHLIRSINVGLAMLKDVEWTPNFSYDSYHEEVEWSPWQQLQPIHGWISWTTGMECSTRQRRSVCRRPPRGPGEWGSGCKTPTPQNQQWYSVCRKAKRYISETVKKEYSVIHCQLYLNNKAFIFPVWTTPWHDFVLGANQGVEFHKSA